MCYDIFSLYIIAETCISVCSTDNTDKGIHKLKPRAKDEILNWVLIIKQALTVSICVTEK